MRRTISGRFATVAVGIGTAAAAAVGVLAGPGTAVAQSMPNAASSGPLFVNTDALPHGARYGTWHGGAAVAGVPGKAPFCLGGEFDAKATKFRTYSANSKVAGQEYLTVLPSQAAATAFAAKLGRDLQECYKSWLSLNIPAYHDHKRSASWEKYASSNPDSTMTVYGVFTVPPKGYDPATHLFGVGQEGNTVMVLHLSMPGTRSSAPIQAFTQSANTALQVMYP